MGDWGPTVNVITKQYVHMASQDMTCALYRDCTVWICVNGRQVPLTDARTHPQIISTKFHTICSNLEYDQYLSTDSDLIWPRNTLGQKTSEIGEDFQRPREGT